ncbi:MULTISPECIES: preprotein translocase subunit SecG [Eubacteriales]|uniref:Protein-export membrane protein SecG n=1 Tax=Allofournierella massiliensis TaxID=1650663 RepID=A0A4V2QB95_9FIRM|nr:MULTISPECIES: preprotein translocase subunit SecG [Eubacteriales]OUN15596.1 preprotein translocase subunit SecG [Gemmiger sp. An87]MDM8199978.1 preprotein translocase subunit SecG [Fournierella massiliensis]MDY4167246.1 preprotein translocase subunit SecG [Fournierella sp.]OUN84529.1 preprotein translocase subunit SecG [Gemmiger sp. An50]TCL55542.1 preprotein translocase subunit SecG [Fournierella massiliensis]
MSIIEIISGVVLILAAIVIVFLTLSQESKGRGLSGAIAGEGGMMEAGRTRAKDVKLAKYTKIVGIVFFVVMIAVSVLSVMSMN